MYIPFELARFVYIYTKFGAKIDGPYIFARDDAHPFVGVILLMTSFGTINHWLIAWRENVVEAILVHIR